MLSNIIKTDGAIEFSKNDSINAEIQAKMGTKFLKVFNADMGSNIQAGKSDSQRVLENFKVTMTKSLILSEVMERCKIITSFQEDILEGQLLRIDNVSLSLENETDLRTAKILSNDTFKGLKIPEAGDIDISNILNSLLKDYSYKIKGSLAGDNGGIIIKIPLTFESEFENLYSVDDLFIGKVTILGIYKGKIKLKDLKNSFEFFQELGQESTLEDELDIHNSQLIEPSGTEIVNVSADKEYHYIDLLAIVQVVQPEVENETNTEKKKKRKRKNKK